MAGLNDAPKGMRLQIAFLGRRNVGKSSLINALTRQDTSLVSDVPGTTTDPVEKQMELLPLGPVTIVDTAGIDDEGALGAARVERTERVLESADVVVVAAESSSWGPFEDGLVALLEEKGTPYVVAATKCDLRPDVEAFPPRIAERAVRVSAAAGSGIDDLADAIAAAVPEGFLADPAILCDLIPEGGLAVLVVPVDKEAPKGRLILPQVQAIRDLLDGHCMALVAQDADLPRALSALAAPPDIVVTDSQVFGSVSKMVPESIPLTGFSLLMARFKGDLATLVRGAGTLGQLGPGSRVLIAESCTHHPICDDIGTVKIPRMLAAKVSEGLTVEHSSGMTFPDDLSGYDLVIHCGGCMLNRTGMGARLRRCEAAGVPVTNYGMAIAHTQGILPRALQPFPGMAELYAETVAGQGRA